MRPEEHGLPVAIDPPVPANQRERELAWPSIPKIAWRLPGRRGLGTQGKAAVPGDAENLDLAHGEGSPWI
jgi:hypothetical protein